MRFHSAIVLLGAAASLAFAQSLSELPACAQQAGLAGIDATGCSVTNTTCICDSVINGPFITTLETYIEMHCDAADQAAALGFAKLVCPDATGIPASVAAPSSTSVAPVPVAATPGLTITTFNGTATSTTSSGMGAATGMTSIGGMVATASMPTPATFTGAASRVWRDATAAVAAAVVVAIGAFVAAF